MNKNISSVGIDNIIIEILLYDLVFGNAVDSIILMPSPLIHIHLRVISQTGRLFFFCLIQYTYVIICTFLYLRFMSRTFKL
jgi:hypothetical protein